LREAYRGQEGEGMNAVKSFIVWFVGFILGLIAVPYVLAVLLLMVGDPALLAEARHDILWLLDRLEQAEADLAAERARQSKTWAFWDNEEDAVYDRLAGQEDVTDG
jgi:hypothetical protein